MPLVDIANVSIAAFQCQSCIIKTTGKPLKWHRKDEGCPICSEELVPVEKEPKKTLLRSKEL